MKSILETLREDTMSLVQWCEQAQDERLDEGIKDILKSLASKFKQVVNYLFGFVARLKNSSYWVAVEEDGSIMCVISPLTAGQAYADGMINKESTVVYLGGKGNRITGCKGKPSDCAKLYGSGNTLDYWKRMVRESKETGRPLNEMLKWPMLNLNQEVNEVKMHTMDPQAKYNVLDTPGLKKAVRIALTNKKLNRLLIFGAPGIGKTAILQSVLGEFGMEDNLITKTLSNETPDNFTLPKYVEVDGQEKATDIPKTWLPVYKPTGDSTRDAQLDEACGKGLLFIDELSRATPQVLNVMLPLINEGQFNGYKIGSGWTIICASNRAEDEMSGQADIGNALGNRFRIVYYEPTCKSWSEWAKTQGYMSPLLLSWLNMPEHENMSGGKYFYWDPNEDGDYNDPSKIMCTPRSWTNAMRVVCAYMETADMEGFKLLDVPRDILACALNECVPAQAIDSFLAFLEVISKVGDFDSVVRDIWKKGGGNFKINKRDLALVSLPLAQLIITSHAKSLPTKEEFDNLCTWLVNTKSDQLASYVLDIIQNVYAGMLPEHNRGGILILRKYMDNIKRTAPNKIPMYEATYKKFLDAWGYTFDNLPDWSAGHAMLGRAFGQAFQNATVDGQEGLG